VGKGGHTARKRPRWNLRSDVSKKSENERTGARLGRRRAEGAADRGDIQQSCRSGGMNDIGEKS
jgi:hypothetical protein